MERLEKQLAFIKEAEGLKSVTREAWTADGRRESTAEHSWRLALFAGLLAGDLGVDVLKALMMCLVHDLGERYMGDIPAVFQKNREDKHREEERDVKRLFALLPEDQGEVLLALWHEYNACSTPEAKLVKALDKAETITQHSQGKNPPDFDYEFNLEYGKGYFEHGEVLGRLRELVDEGMWGRIKRQREGENNW